MYRWGLEVTLINFEVQHEAHSRRTRGDEQLVRAPMQSMCEDSLLTTVKEQCNIQTRHPTVHPSYCVPGSGFAQARVCDHHDSVLND